MLLRDVTACISIASKSGSRIVTGKHRIRQNQYRLFKANVSEQLKNNKTVIQANFHKNADYFKLSKHSPKFIHVAIWKTD